MAPVPQQALPGARTVGVRYVGQAPYKDDTLLYRRGRRWARGEVLQVPEGDAQSYFKHYGVWRPESEPWDATEIRQALTDAQLGATVRAAAAAQGVDPSILLSAIQTFGGPQETPKPGANVFCAVPPLHRQDAERLHEFVPALARALTLANERTALQQIEAVGLLLLAFPPLLDGCIEAEAAGQARKGLGERLADLRRQVAAAVGEDAGGEAQGQLFAGEEGAGA